MKQKTLATSIIILLFIFIGFAFQYGEKIIHQDSAKDFSAFSFSSTQYEIKNKDDLSNFLKVDITNNEFEKKEYDVDYKIDGYDIESIKVDVLGGKSKEITPPEKVINYLKIKPAGIFYTEILIKWDNSEDMLTKNIIISND